MKKNETRRALLLSLLALALCLSLMVGTTLAWFTDSVTTGVNKITAGNLDVELEYSTDGSNWNTVTETTNIFNKDALWEPGYTEVVYLRVKNVGTLALKYQFGIHVAGKGIGKTAEDKDIDLSQYIEFGVVETNAKFASRADARNAVAQDAVPISQSYSSGEGKLAGKTDGPMLAMVVYMPEEVGNEANHGTGKTAPEIDMGIILTAAQDTVEHDSFGPDYDAPAVYPVAGLDAFEAALEAAEDGTVITLGAGDYETTAPIAINKDITIVGNGGAIRNLKLVGTGDAKLTIKDAVIIGDSYILENGMDELTMTGCKVNVNLAEKQTGRAAFLVTGTTENNRDGIKLDIRDNQFVVSSTKDAYSAAIFGWAYIADGSVISGNTFGAEYQRFNFVAVKLMNFTDGANVTISGNTVYGNSDYGFYAFDMYQNTSRANAYTATFTDNAIDIDGNPDNDRYFVDLEYNSINGEPGHGTILIGSGNTLNGSPVTQAHVLIEQKTAGQVIFQ